MTSVACARLRPRLSGESAWLLSANLPSRSALLPGGCLQDGEGEVDPNRPVIKPVHQQSLFGV